MGRLIDIDSLKGCAIIRPTSHETIEHIKQFWDDCLNHDDIPTAFDTEKVVEQLEEEGQKMAEAKPTKPYGKSSPSCHRYYKAISVKKAIDIVKKGGGGIAWRD